MNATTTHKNPPTTQALVDASLDLIDSAHTKNAKPAAYDKLYACTKSGLTTLDTRPRCGECAYWKPYYTKRSNGSYKEAADGIGYCTSPDKAPWFRDYRPAEFKATCANFKPDDPAAFTHVWIRTEPQ